MKNLIIILIGACVIIFTPKSTFGQKNIKQFLEANVGYGYNSLEGLSMSGSILYGRQKKISKIFLREWEVGVALPYFVTTKFSWGFGTKEHNIMLSIRPWPMTVGPQLNLGSFYTSFEFGVRIDNIRDMINTLDNLGFSSTFGYRHTISSKKDKDKKIKESKKEE